MYALDDSEIPVLVLFLYHTLYPIYERHLDLGLGLRLGLCVMRRPPPSPFLLFPAHLPIPRKSQTTALLTIIHLSV